MSLELIIGLGIVGFLLAYLFFKSGDDYQEHVLLRILLLGLLFGVFILIGSAGLDSTTSCDVIISNQTEYEVVGNATVTEFSYDTLCYEKGSDNTALSFYQLTLWIVRLVSTYLIIYLVYKIFLWTRDVIGGKRGRTKE